MTHTYPLPVLEGLEGRKFFVFDNLDMSKDFYDSGEFDEEIGAYPIFDESGNVVEYMDLLGNFSNKPTSLAKFFYRYVCTEEKMPFFVPYPQEMFYITGLLNFPSKFMVDEKVRQAIKKEELRRYRLLSKDKIFPSLIVRLQYKAYLKSILKQKVCKANKLKSLIEQQSKLNSSENGVNI